MAAVDTARLIASLELKDQLTPGLAKAEGGIDKLNTKLGKVGGIAAKGAKTAAGNLAKIGIIGAGAVAAIGAASVKAGLQSLADLERLTKQTEAVIESTGGKAGVSAAQVGEYAESLEDLSTVDDKVIRDGENMLLTFTNIGGSVFPDATKAMVNMGVAMAGGDASAVDLKATAIQLGKALNDPIKGVGALAEVGVSFTEQQKEQIKAMVEAGDVAGAQTLILKELETEFGNAGEAAGTGYAADMRRLDDAVEGAQMALAEGFLPVIQEVTKFLNEKLRDKGFIDAIKELGTKGAGLLKEAFEAAKSIPWETIGNAFQFMGTGAKAAFDIFMGMPDWVKTAVISGWGLNKLTGGALSGIVGELGKGLVKGVLGMTAGVVNIKAATVTGAGGGAAGAGGSAGGAIAGIAGGATTLGAITLAVDQLGRLPTFIQGAQESLNAKTLSEWKTGWNDVWQGSTLLTAFSSIKGAIEHAFGLDKIDAEGTRTVGAQGGLKGPTTVVPGPGFTEWMHSQATADSSQSTSLAALAAKMDANNNGQVSFREAMAAQLGRSVAELVALKQASGGWNATLAARLGITNEKLTGVKAEAAKIAGKNWSPTIRVTSNFNVSARAIASATRIYRTQAGRQGVGVE